MYIFGVDISRHNGAINHHKCAASGAKFAAIRCTVGDYYIDTSWRENYSGFTDAGIKTLAYLVVVPQNSLGLKVTAEAHVNLFLKAVEKRCLDFPPVLDCELPKDVMSPDRAWITSLITEICRLLLKETGEYPIIYTRKTWWDPCVYRADYWKHYPLWTAHYTNAPQPLLPSDWDTWQLWQYSSRGPGFKFGTEEQFIDLNHMQLEFWQRYISVIPSEVPRSLRCEVPRSLRCEVEGSNLIPIHLDIAEDAFEGYVEKIV